jgi:hypothetical protein
MLAFVTRQTPLEFVPVPHEVPLNEIEPELVVTQETYTWMPQALFVPFAAVPVIETLPVPVAEILPFVTRRNPAEFVPLPHEVPLTVSEPELAVK